MHLVPCPECDAKEPVALGKAGDQIPCSQCQAIIAVPKLGDLRKLPAVDGEENPRSTRSGGRSSESSGSPIPFILTGICGLIALLVAVYCGIRWSLIEVPMTTERHIAEFEKGYQKAEPSLLINEYEDMEKYGLELGLPLTYIGDQNLKDEWGTSMMVSGAVSGAAFLIAIGLAVANGKTE